MKNASMHLTTLFNSFACAFLMSVAASNTASAQAPAYCLGPTFNTQTAPASLVSADVNGDGKADLVIGYASGNTVTVMFGNGNGTFGPMTQYTTGASPFPSLWRT